MLTRAADSLVEVNDLLAPSCGLTSRRERFAGARLRTHIM